MQDLELVKRFEPVLLFSKDGENREEYFFPMSTIQYIQPYCALYSVQPQLKQLISRGNVTLEKLAHLIERLRIDFLSYVTHDVLYKLPISLTTHPLTSSRLHGQMTLSLLMPAYKAERARKSILPRSHIVELSPLATHLFTKLHTPITSFSRLQTILTHYDLQYPTTHEDRIVHLLIPGNAPQTDSLPKLTTNIFTGFEAETEHLISQVTTDFDRLYLGLTNNDTLPEGQFSLMPQWILKRAREHYAPYQGEPPVYHYRVRHEGNKTYIEYWFFYAYNDWGTGHGGLNDHEGDWEGIMVTLQNELPIQVDYSCHVSKETRTWQATDLQKYNNNHPIAFVGCGTHANYIKPGKHQWPYIDYALGNYKGVGPAAYVKDDSSPGPGQKQTWGEPLNLDTIPSAADFKGLWGVLWPGLGTFGPSGPSASKPWTEA